jgi:hypothetical protein
VCYAHRPMSATLLPSPLQPSQLALDSCRANNIDNERLYEISTYESNLFRKFDTDYGLGIQRRCDPTPLYNCHGLTFASRRTGIFDSNALKQILNEDGYVEIHEDVMAGDVIIYFDTSGDFEHSGIVISPPTKDNLNVPFVCSKWGKYAELLHQANNCPYSFANVKYYRLKP